MSLIDARSIMPVLFFDRPLDDGELIITDDTFY